MKLYLDSSALVKRYVEEKSSEEVADLCARADTLVSSVISFSEVFSSLNRRLREKQLSPSQYRQCKVAFLKEYKEMTRCLASEEILSVSAALLEKFPLRAMDAIHLASALDSGPDLFVSFDNHQLAAAKTLGLKTQ